MKNHKLFLVFCILSVCLMPKVSYPCTTFCLDRADQHMVGKNFDWMWDDGLIIINKRNVSKTVISNPEMTDYQPASWTSKYGSVTFNQYGREFPLEGMNETGLVVEFLLRTGTEYPVPDSRPYIGVLQWVQYQLDNCSSVEEVIATDSQLRIVQPILEGHFFVSDRMGSYAIIEFIGGEMVYHVSETAPVKALTNNVYEESLAFLYEHEGWGGDLPIPQGESSLDRFVRAADMLRDYDQETSVIDYAFITLENVAQSESRVTPTQWAIVYDKKDHNFQKLLGR